MMSGKDFSKSHILSWRRKVYSDWEDVRSSGRAFQVFGSATGKTRLPSDTWSRSWRHKSTPLFWRWFLVHVLCKSGTGVVWYQTVLFQAIHWHTLDWNDDFAFPFQLLVFGFNACYNNSDHNDQFIIYITFSHVNLGATNFHYRSILHEKPAKNIGATKWSCLMASVSGGCVMRIIH